MHRHVNQASTCLPPPVPRGDRHITRCPPQPGSHRVRAPKAGGPAIRHRPTRHQATAKMKALAGSETPANPPLARGTRGRRPFLSLAGRQRRQRCVRKSYSALPQLDSSFPRRRESINAAFEDQAPRLWIPDQVRDDEEKVRWHSTYQPAQLRVASPSRPPPPPKKPHPRLWCSPLTQRIVPDEARITTLSVVSTPSRRRLTPSSSEPAVTPVAAKIASPFTRSSSS